MMLAVCLRSGAAAGLRRAERRRGLAWRRFRYRATAVLAGARRAQTLLTARGSQIVSANKIIDVSDIREKLMD
jgi:hypothetical protein